MRMKPVLVVIFLGLLLGLAACGPARSSVAVQGETASGGSQSFGILLNSAQKGLTVIADKSLSSGERRKQLEKFKHDLLMVLQAKESAALDDKQLQMALPTIQAKTKDALINGQNIQVRLVTFDSFTRVPVGTLERYWYAVQWQDSSRVQAQVLCENGGSTPMEFLIVQIGGQPALITAEYANYDGLVPWFMKVWQLHGDEWVKAEVFRSDVAGKDGWDIKVRGNSLSIQSKPAEVLRFRSSDEGNGFVFYLRDDNTRQITLKVAGDEIMAIEK